ncbi:14014_t:CDS:2 [Rhizophagus irregularis]|nr:14014_t:CDS:2 [Rhizophagus irregularis]
MKHRNIERGSLHEFAFVDELGIRTNMRILQYCHGSWSSEGVLRKSRQIICFPIDVEEALSNPFVFLII